MLFMGSVALGLKRLEKHCFRESYDRLQMMEKVMMV